MGTGAVGRDYCALRWMGRLTRLEHAMEPRNGLHVDLATATSKVCYIDDEDGEKVGMNRAGGARPLPSS